MTIGMMTNFRFTLAPYRRGSKINCPQCGAKESLRRYIDLQTGEYLPDHVGLCDREEKCGYKYTWWDWVRDENISVNKDFKIKPSLRKIIEKPEHYNTIPVEVFKRSLNGHKFEDEFSKYVLHHFKNFPAKEVLDLYKVGYTHTWGRDCTIFWQIDKDRNIRTGKIMAYENREGDIKRVKFDSNGVKRPLINWAHSFYMDRDEFVLSQCFFGEHLLPMFPDKPIEVVESEKTAVLGAIVCPDRVWLATGMLQGLSAEKMEVLREREIFFLPDKGKKAMKVWKKKSNDFKKKGFNVQIDDSLERIEFLEEGEDMADYIIKMLIHKKNLGE